MTVATASLGQEARVISLVTGAHFFSHFYQLVLPPVFLQMTREFGVGYVELGLLVSAFSVTSGITQTPIGFLVDRFGARLPLILGLAVLSLSVALYGVAPSYEWLLLLAVVGGVANSVFHPADFAILSGSVSSSRLGRAFSIHGVSGNLGWAAAPVCVLTLTAIWDVRTAFIVLGLAGFALSLVLCMQAGHLRDERDGPSAAPAKAKDEGAPAPNGVSLLLSKPVMLLFFFQLVFAMAFGGVRNFSVAAISVLNDIPTALVAGALTGYLIGASFGNLLGGWLADRTGRPAFVFFACVSAVCVLILLIGLVPMPIAVLSAVMALAGTLQGSLLPARDLLVRAISPPGQMGKVFGFTSSGLSLGNAITPPLFGWIMDHGDPQWVFLCSAIFMAICMVTYGETSRSARR